MCRVLSYLGLPIKMEELLYHPDNSFIKQSYNPQHMSHLLNLAGFGMTAWDTTSNNIEFPYIYKTARLPFYDENLRNLASKINPYCILSHIRGVAYSEHRVVSNQNVHPFIFNDTNIALAHNGSLSHFDIIKFDLLNYIKPEFSKRIRGTTDSEWIYALFLSQLPKTVDTLAEPEVISKALIDTFIALRAVRKKHHIAVTSPINLFISNGQFIAATRFALDFGWPSTADQDLAHLTYHSLWYTYGEKYGYYDGEYQMKNGDKKLGIIIASEPLTEDTTTWVEMPEYSLMIAWRENKEIKIYSQDINI